jgi:hypothetical protein
VLLAALVLGGAAIAAGAVFFAMRPHDHPSIVAPSPPPPVVTQPVITPADASTAPVQVAVAPDAAVAARHDTPKPVTPQVAPVEATADTSAGNDAEAEARLVAADQAMHDKLFPKVESLANLVITGEHASDRQRAHAHMLRGIVMCAAHNDIEGAGIDLRAVHGFPAMRHRMLKECHDAGFLQDQN